MDKITPDRQSLIDSFKRVKKNQTPIERECRLLQEAERFSMPLESYRKLFEIYNKNKIDELFLDNYPKFELQNWWKIVGRWWRWFTRHKKLLFFKILDFVIQRGAIATAGIAAIHYLWTIPARQQQAAEQKKQAQYQAWQIINSATGKRASGGRSLALQDLNHDHISLEGLEASGAYLRFINLEHANLQYANLNKADLTGAKLPNTRLLSANLQQAHLSGVDFSGANLRKANLIKANIDLLCMKNFKGKSDKFYSDFKTVILDNANLEDADLSGVKNLTVEQIKSAKNWEKAHYDPFFRKQLGLPPENLYWTNKIKESGNCQ